MIRSLSKQKNRFSECAPSVAMKSWRTFRPSHGRRVPSLAARPPLSIAEFQAGGLTDVASHFTPGAAPTTAPWVISQSETVSSPQCDDYRAKVRDRAFHRLVDEVSSLDGVHCDFGDCSKSPIRRAELLQSVADKISSVGDTLSDELIGRPLIQPMDRNGRSSTSRPLSDMCPIRRKPIEETLSMIQHWESDRLSKAAHASKMFDGFAESRDAGVPQYVVNMTEIIGQVKRWRRRLPFVKAYYAVKCLPDPAVVSLLAALECGFDCASPAEFALLREAGVDAETIARGTVYANPCKAPAHLRQVGALFGAALTTLDCESEARKIAETLPRARALLRLKVDDSASICQFSSKFGADLAEALPILRACHEAGLSVAGVCFHVGSGCQCPTQYARALRDCRAVFDAVAADETLRASPHFANFSVIDIGGGFPGVERTDNVRSSMDTGDADAADSAVLFAEIADCVAQSMDEYFGDDFDFRGADGVGHLQGLTTCADALLLGAEPVARTASGKRPLAVIAEPGRYFVTKSHTLIADVIAKKRESAPPRFRYYLNEGVYQSFNCLHFDHAQPLLLTERDGDAHSTVLFGPTCDSMDTIAGTAAGLRMPELDIGDRVIVPAFGAYTLAAGSAFNGFGKPLCRYVL